MELILGSAQFGMSYGLEGQSQIKARDFDQIMAQAKYLDIKKIDTAFSYGDAHERILNSKFYSDYEYITKIPSMQRLNSKNLMVDTLNKFLQNSEKCFNKNLYGILFHDQNDYTSKNNSLELIKLINKFCLDKNIKVGCSCYDINAIHKAIDKGANLLQMSFNCFDQRLKSCRDIFQENITLHVRSIFLQGALLMKLEKVEKIFPEKKNYFGMWHDWLSEKKLKPLEGALSHVKSLDFCSGVVVGVSTFSELEEIVDVWREVKPISEINLQTFDEYLIDPRLWKK